MTKINMAEELRKRGFKLTPLPPPTPEQMQQIQEANKDVVNFLKKIDEARKASAKSTLRFATSTVSSDVSFDQVEVVGEIDIQKLSPAQRRVYDVVNEYSKKLQAARKRPIPNFVVARHGRRRSLPLNTQKQR